MEVYESFLPPGTYLAALKERCSNPFLMFEERVTGIVIGRFFSVAYYCPWEWNRRITNECNRAMGFIKETDGKTQVCFIRSRGMFSLFWLLFWALISLILCGVMIGGWDPVMVPVSAGISFLICLITASESALTDNGQQGAWIVTDLLKKPDEFYYC